MTVRDTAYTPHDTQSHHKGNFKDTGPIASVILPLRMFLFQQKPKYEAVRKQMVSLQEKLKSTSADVEEKKKQLKGALLANKTTLERLNRAKMENERLSRRIDSLTNENQNLKEQLEASKTHYDDFLTPGKITDLVQETAAASRAVVDSTPHQHMLSAGEFETSPAKKASPSTSRLFNMNHEAFQSQDRFPSTSYRNPSTEVNKWHLDNRTAEVYAHKAAERQSSQSVGEVKALNLGSPVGGVPKATSAAAAAPPNQSQGCGYNRVSPRRTSGGDVVAAAHVMDRLPTSYRVVNPLHSPDGAKLRRMISAQEKSPFQRMNKA
ncbi:unnamed protein product [Mesocestoides corti]|uniref:Uncharacterized protein n=2 Tax=Mesocestoides corti TaxID=53468 RepID=A0A158QTE9_MESCO|nr:unnamed protein product [Mesocestoides corti]